MLGFSDSKGQSGAFKGKKEMGNTLIFEGKLYGRCGTRREPWRQRNVLIPSQAKRLPEGSHRKRLRVDNFVSERFVGIMSSENVEPNYWLPGQPNGGLVRVKVSYLAE